MAKAPDVDLNAVLARNLKYWMSREGCPYPNANKLGKAAKISPNSVRNYMDHTKRPATGEKAEGFPTVDKLAVLASKLGCAVWELLHPDIEQSRRERAIYEQFQADFERVQRLRSPTR